MKTRRVIAGLLATAMVITGISIAPKKIAEAADAKDKIVYEYVEELTPGEAPLFDGVVQGYTDPVAYYNENGGEYADSEITVESSAEYLFGGWYQIIESDQVYLIPIEDEDFEIVEDALGYYFAKWVPASLLSVKAQNKHDAKTASSTDTRLLSSVDCLDYQTVGFKVQLKNDPNKDLGLMETTKVYEKLFYRTEGNVEKNITAAKVFGDEAKFFVVWSLKDIASTYYNEIIYVKPYWVTADGVTVYGLPKYVHVIDGINKYVSVPVNLTDLSEDNKVAAGVFEISYDASKLKLADVENGNAVETGRVFEELEFADKGGKIKFAANVADINTNADENDIFVNLRFELVSGEVAHTSYHFEIADNSEDFCDNNETKKDVDIWDVLY